MGNDYVVFRPFYLGTRERLAAQKAFPDLINFRTLPVGRVWEATQSGEKIVSTRILREAIL